MKYFTPPVTLPAKQPLNNKTRYRAALLLLLLCSIMRGFATNYTSSTTGNWSSSATWGGAGVPGSSDNVTIAHGTTVTVNGNYTCNNVTIGDATATAATLTVSSTNTLTINGACSINPSNGSSTYTLNAATGTVNVAGTLSWSTSGTNILETGSGTITFTPAVTIASSNQNIKATSSGGLVSFLSSFTDNYNKLSIVSGATAKFAGNYTVSTTAATWSAGTALFSGTGTITANSNLTLYNLQTATSAATTLASASGTVIVTNAVTTGSGATFTTNNNLEVDGNWTNSGSTLVPGSSTITFNGTTTITGTTTFGSMQVGNTASSNTVNLTLDNSVTCSAVTINGYNKARTLTISNGDTLTVTGNLVIDQPTAAKTNALSVNGGTCIINGNLTFSGTATTSSYVSKVTVTTGLLTVNGNLNFDANTVAANQLVTLTSTGVITFNKPVIMAYGTLSSTSSGIINFNGSEPSLTFGGASGPAFSTNNGSTINFANGFINNSNALSFATTSNSIFTGNGTIKANAAITFGNTQFNAIDSLASTGNAVSIAGTCYLAPGSTFKAYQDLSITGNLVTIGTGSAFRQNGGTLSVYGDIIDSGTIHAASGGTISLVGNGSNIGGTGTINAATGAVVITNDKTIISGTALTFGSNAGNTSLSVGTNTTISNNGSIVFYGGVLGTDSSSVWLNSVNGYLSVTGELLDTGSLDASTVPNTIEYNGNGTQVVTSPINSYYNLTASVAGVKLMTGPIQVDNSVTLNNQVMFIEGPNILSGLASLNMNDSAVLQLQRSASGTYPELSGTYTLAGGTVMLSQNTNPAVVTGAQYNNLVLTGSNAFDISAVNTINNNLTIDTAAWLSNTSGLSVGNLFIDSSSGYSTLNGSLTALGVGLYSGTLDDGGNTIYIEGAAGWTNSGGNFNSTGVTSFWNKFATPQPIGGSSSTTFNYLQIDNIGGAVTLSLSPAAPTIVSGTLDLTSGNLNTDAGNILRMLNGSTVANGGSFSYVNGPMVKVGTDDFVFPLGKGGHYGQAGISGMTTATTEVTGEYFDNPYSTLSPLDTNLTQVSNHEYWNIERTVTTDSLHLTLYWAPASFSDIIQCQNLTIAHYTGGEWVYVPSTVISGSACMSTGTGSIESNGYISTFSPFTFGSWDQPGGQALPVTLVSFTATPSNKQVVTNWQTAVEINTNYFTVERSADGKNFTAIGTVKAAGNSTAAINYQLPDPNPLPGISYYRLTTTDLNGNTTTSQVVAVNMTVAGTITVYPNPAKGQAYINLSNPAANVNISIYNAIGDLVFSKAGTGSEAGSTLIAIPTLPAGIYTVSVNNGGDALNQMLVVQ